MHWWFEAMDTVRRRRGAAMDGVGLGPQECDCEVVLTLPGLRLRFYGGGGDTDRPDGAGQRIALIVPAPIKRHYIWDLLPECSAVRRMLDDGMHVYLIEWIDPEDELAQAGLDQYACAWLDRCVEAIRTANPNAPLFLFSHSLGGILATIYSALRPQQIAGLVLLEAPLHFGIASGSFIPMLALSPAASTLTRNASRIPGSLLSMASAGASPSTFQIERVADFIASSGSRADLHRHMLVERWTLDEAPMAARLFEQIVDGLYREDSLMLGTLVVNGKTIGPQHVHTPLLAVYDPGSLIIPPQAVIAFQEAAASTEKQILPFSGDVGVALSHVATLVGPRAHRELWPRILAWTRALKRKRKQASRGKG